MLAIALPLVAEFDWMEHVARSVEFRPDTQYDTDRLAEIVSVAPGKELTVGDVQQSIRSLFATGDFRDIVVDASPVDDGVGIVFLLSIHYRVGAIAFEGLTDEVERAARELVIRQDDVLSLSAVDRSASEVQRLLTRRGWLAATIDPEVRYDRAHNRANVTFHVEMNARSTVSRIDLEGDTGPFQHDELVRRTRIVVGEPYDRQAAREAVGRLIGFLVRNNRRMADVRFVGEEPDTEAHSVVVRFAIDVGPVVRVRVEGIPRDTIRKLLPFRRDEPYSRDEIDRARGRILEALQLRGHYFTEIRDDERDENGEHVVTLHVTPGPRVALAHVRFEGADAVDPRRLAEVIETGPTGLAFGLVSRLTRRSTAVTTEALTRDREALETFYRLDGFTEARVGRAIVTRDDSTIEVEFPISEGPRTIVTAVSVDGMSEISPRRLPEPRLRDGAPLSPRHVAEDVVALKTFYAREGFTNVEVDPSIMLSEDRTRAIVVYRVTEGTRVRIGEVSVRGNTFTRDDVALRKSKLRTGQPFSFLELLDAQQNLYRLGIFQRVDLEPRPAGATTTERDVVIRVEEGKALTVASSLGYSTEDGFRGTASISHRNLFGTGRYLGFDATLSQRVNRAALTWREPFLVRWDFPTQITVFRREELRVHEDAKISSLGTFVEATRLDLETRWSVRYEYRIVECVVRRAGDLCDLATGDLPIEGLPREDQEIRISSITPSVFWDRRDDPLNATRGFYTGGSLEYAFPVFRARTTFLKGFAQGVWHRPTGPRTHIVVSARLGLIEPLGSSGDGLVVPFAERFTAGGETTNRAFDLDLLGIPCDTLIPDPASIPPEVPADTPCADLAKRSDVEFIATGGNALVLVNAELRFPLYGESVRGALFLDGGNVWSRIGVVDPLDLRWGLGAGLRYLTPVGPLRLDFGYKLDRNPFEGRWATFLTLGHAF